MIALDGPAHGRSPGREADIVLFARALLEAAGELPPLRAVIGHSMGGASALLATQMGLRTETLVTIGAPSNVLGVLRGFSSVVGLPPVARSRFIRMIEAARGLPPDNWMWRAISWTFLAWWFTPRMTVTCA